MHMLSLLPWWSLISQRPPPPFAAPWHYTLRSGQREGSHVFEVFFNGALLAYKAGDFQVSFELVGWVLGR